VQELIVKMYSGLLRVHNWTQEITKVKDVKNTVKVLLGAVALFVLTFLLSDASFLWVGTNLVMLYPLAYKHKQTLLDNFFAKVNSKIEEKINKSSVLQRIERNHRG